MKLTFILLVAALMNVHAAGLSQTVSFTGRDVPLRKVFAEIKRQTGYTFFYNSESLKALPGVTASVKQMPLQQFLPHLFKNLPLEYTIENRNIVVSKKPLPALPPADSKTDSSPFSPPATINGTIADAEGRPLAGATVSLKNGNGGSTFTDAEGKFTIKASEGDVLTVTYIGYASKEMKITAAMVAGTASLTIVLEREVAGLDTAAVVINTGYQVIKREKMTGATVTVTSTELDKRYTPNVLDNLEGRVPGLVTYRGNTNIRGINSTNRGFTRPLIVLDGLPTEGNISDINPYDVESITVLKDAAASAIYGARAANGVIVINTRRAKGKRTSIEISSDLTLTQKPDIAFDLLTPSQQVDYERDVYAYTFANTGGPYPNTAAAVTNTTTSISNGGPMKPVYYAYYQFARGAITQAQLDEELARYKQNDFRQQYKDNALLNNLLQQYNIAVRSDGARMQSSLIVNYKADNSGIINAYNRQLNIFYKGTYTVNKWLDADFGANTIMGYQKSSNSSIAPFSDNVAPYQQLLDANGKRVYYSTADYNVYNTNPVTQPSNSLLFNHLDELEKDIKNTRLQNTRYFVNLSVRPFKGLTLTPKFQYENLLTNTSAYSEADSYIMRYLKSVYTTLLPSTGGKLATTNQRGDYWTARGQAEYERSFDKHAIDVIAGTEFRQTRTRGTRGLLLGYDEALQTHSTMSVNFPALFAFTRTPTAGFKPGFNPSSLYTAYFNNGAGLFPDVIHRFNSNYANATYTYDDRYNIFGSYRIDYADVFGLDKQFRGRPLWSTGLGWNLHREKFLMQQDWIDFLKLRTSYGIVGNIIQDATSYLTAVPTGVASGTGNGTNTATNQQQLIVNNPANPALRWEKTATYNLGLDFNLFGNRLNGTIDWYRKKTSDVQVRQRIDPSEGFSSTIINNGNVLNNGIDLNLSYEWFRPSRRGAFSWSSSALLSRNTNKITAIDEITVLPLPLVQGGFKVGYPVNALFSLPYKGLNANGQPQWLKGDGTLTTVALTGNDMGAILYSGGTDPRTNITLTNEWHFKGFGLNVLAVYYGGQYFRARVPEVISGVSYGPAPAYLLDSWQPGKTNTIVPGYGKYSPGLYPGTTSTPFSHLAYSDAFVRAGDFIKIRSAILTYELPQRLINKIASRGVRLRFQVNNPKALWMKNDIGYDPETIGARIPTSYVFGININY